MLETLNMQFLLFDVGATLIFLLAYLTVTGFRRRRPLPSIARGVRSRR